MIDPRFTKEVQRARLDCLIFFAVQLHGSPRHVKGQPRPGPVARDSRLGFPGTHRQYDAVQRVRTRCRELADEYKRTVRELREAHRRYNATQSEATWLVYTKHVARRTRIRYWHGAAWNKAGTGWNYKYNIHTLKRGKNGRLLERERARQEFLAASAKMKTLEASIFSRMRVPKEYRGKNLDERSVRKELTRRAAERSELAQPTGAA